MKTVVAWSAWLVVGLTVPACALDGAGLGGGPAEPPEPSLDSGVMDAMVLDASGTDAARGDASTPPDAPGLDDAGGVDAVVPTTDSGPGRPDSGPRRLDSGPGRTDAGPGCSAIAEVCDGVDDDCDARIDEGIASCSMGRCDRQSRGRRSYLFCHASSIQTDWHGARDLCRTMGYQLVIIEDAVENEWIRVRAAAIASNQRWWIGASDEAVEGRYVWDATGATVGYTNWNGGSNPQPNDDIRSGVEDWLMLESNATGTWYDHFVQNLRFVCETP